jgi:DNA topoisomerase-3
VEREQMAKLLATGKTDLLDKFVSMRTRRPFKAFLAWDAEAGKVSFEFEPRKSKFPPRAGAGAAGKTRTAKEPAPAYKATAKAAKAVVAKKAPTAKKAAPAKKAAAKKPATPRKTGAGLKPSAALAAVVGSEPIARTEVIKRIWDYIKANGLQDAKDKRSINADAKLQPVFGKPQVTMFELAGIVGKHLTSE